jgi:hypothetical protein
MRNSAAGGVLKFTTPGEKAMKMKLPDAALFVLLTGCGSTTADREATCGLLGLGLGVLAAGPIGGIVGAGVGLAGGTVAPESVDLTGKRIVARNLPASVKAPASNDTDTSAITGVAGVGIDAIGGEGAGAFDDGRALQ